ncbi:odorant receptor 131-2-like [Leptodactylus fuscus]|uniref:odorant receptor 131-2-like n=1 Tax=Leptodactylus fuscus TaxID=238119 RepID=UPI003F4EAD6C
MVNFTEVNNELSSRVILIVRSTFLTILYVSFVVFLYFVTIILRIFFTSPHVREKARYVLFIHMTINDTLMLSAITMTSPMCIFLVYFPVPLCYSILTFTSSSLRVTPYNLAIMSLEQYFAICHPLRHAEICTVQRSLLAIGVTWLLNLVPQFIDFIAMCYSMPKNFLSTSVLCIYTSFMMNNFQVVLHSSMEFVTFTLVGLVIFCTYVRVMVVARRIGSGKSSALKAKRTLLLHGVQLGLCMMSLTSTVTDTYLKKYFFFMPITNHLLFMHLPRIISPLIYGARDEMFRKHMRKMKIRDTEEGDK